MSLEDQIKRLADATEKQNGLLEQMLKGGKAGAATTTKPADKPADKSADKPANKPAGTKPAAGGKKTPSAAVVSQRFADYMKGGGDEEQRATAISNVRSLVAHYGAPKLTEIDAKHFPRLLEYLEAWEAGEEVEFDELDDAGDDDGDEGGGALL